MQCLVRGDLSALPSPYDPSIKIPYALKTQLDALSVHFESEISSLPIVDAYTKTESDDKFQPKGDYATKNYVQSHTSAIVGYNDTLLSGITEDDQTVEFYILTKNK